MLILFQVVDLFDEVDVLFHETFVDFAVRLVRFLLGLSQVVNVLFQVLSLLLKFTSQVTIVLVLLFEFLLNVNLIQPNHLLL